MKSSVFKCCCLLLTIGVLVSCSSTEKNFYEKESSAELNAKLGLEYMRQGNYKIAMLKLEKAINQDPELITAHLYMAELYKAMHSFDYAERSYNKAMLLDKNNASLLNNFGVFLCERSRFLDAEKMFLQATKQPQYVNKDQAFENAGLCSLKKADSLKAEEYFRKALEINPKLNNSLYQMAKLSVASKNFLQARAFFQRFIQLSPYTADNLNLGIKIERSLGDSSAVKNYQKILDEKFPNVVN